MNGYHSEILYITINASTVNLFDADMRLFISQYKSYFSMYSIFSVKNSKAILDYTQYFQLH